MSGNDAVVAVLSALDALAIDSMIVGSYSSNAYGVERATHDADIVIEVDRPFVAELQRLLGPGFRIDPQMSFEGVTGTRRHVIEIADNDFRVELFYLGDDEHDRARFARRRPTAFRGRTAYLPTAEDVIIMKLRWAAGAGRDKDRGDVRDVLSVQGGNLDFGYIHSWCDRHGTRALLDEIRASIPPID